MNILHFIKWKVSQGEVAQLQDDLINGRISIMNYFELLQDISVENASINTFEDLKANFKEYRTDIEVANQLMKNEPTICN